MALTIDNYTPDLPGEHWAHIGPFVREAVADCDLRTPYTAQMLLGAAAQHVRWCWQTAGLPLDRGVIFHRQVIEEFTQRAQLEVQGSTRGNYRARLLRMSEILLEPQDRVVRLKPMPAGTPTTPYTTFEITALRSWANGQNTTYRSVNCNVLLSLGLGAGLSASEIADVRACHVFIDAEGVLVTVIGSRPRVVPVLGEWEDALIQVASAAMRADMFMFRPTRVTTNPKNLIGNFVDKTASSRVRASSQRMRTTWIVTQLAAGTPPKVLLEAAGVDSLEALNRFVRFVPDVDPAAARRAVRDAYRQENPLP